MKGKSEGKTHKHQFPFESKPTHPVAADWGNGKEATQSGCKGKNAGMEVPKGVWKESGKP